MARKAKKPRKKAKKPEKTGPEAVHFIGIGGIGMSALAQWYLSEGWKVSGSDEVRSPITDDLKQKKVKITIGHKRETLSKKPDLIIYSAAIPEDNPERKVGRRRRVTQLSYAEALGRLTKQYATIAVSGSHGKSTTASMIALALKKGGFDPTVIIGTKLKELKGNFRKGKSEWLVIEADEYNKSFHQYTPQIAVVTNIDKEHLDTYKTYRGVVMGFSKFLKRVPKGGFIVANHKEKGVQQAAKGLKGRVLWYNRKPFPKHPLAIPGKHNQRNAEAAWTACKTVGVSRKDFRAALNSFKGSWRRFEKLKSGGLPAELYTDYAHHPTEIRATLDAMREKYSNRKLICVFQPHLQDRFERLFDDFKTVFKDADLTMILPIYRVSGRESEGGRTAKDLVQAIDKKNVLHIEDIEEAMFGIEMFSNERPVVIFMSAGDLDQKLRARLAR